MFRILVILAGILLYSSSAFGYVGLHVGLHHQESNKNVYLLEQGDIYQRQILVNDLNSDSWYRVAGNYFWMTSEYYAEDFYPLLSIDAVNHYYLNTDTNKIIEGNQYSKSPDENWGYFIDENYRRGKLYSVMIKNFKTGEIYELFETNSSLRTWWLEDNTLLLNKYSEKKKQYEIVIYDPQEGSYKDVTLGRLYRFSPENKLILYVKNEPQRKRWIYDLKTGSEKLLTTENEEKLFKQGEYYRVPEPPTSIDFNKLPVITPEFETLYENELQFDEVKIPVYYVFVKDNKTFIPLRPLMDRFNLIVAKDYKNIISKTKEVALSSNNSIIYHNRLFVTPEVLQKSGLGKFTIESNIASQDIAKVDDVTLFASQKAGDIFKEITIQTKDKSKSFSWNNVTNATYYPIVKIVDIDADGKEELVVVLTKGHGTGVDIKEIHVLNKEDLTEISVEDPVEAVEKKVASTISKNNGKVNVAIETDGKKLEKHYNESDAGMWNERVAFGSIVTYEVSDNKITANVPGAVTPSEFPVTAVVEYGSDLKVKNITVKEN